MEGAQSEVAPVPAPAVPTTPTKSIYQTSPFIWSIRFIQFIFAVTIVSITGEAISDWRSLGCSSPPRLSLNFAVALITLLLTLYLLLSTGTNITLKIHYWNIFAQLGFDILFSILWIIVSALANYSCSDVCKACSVPGAEADIGYGFVVTVSDMVCDCVFADDYDAGYKLKRLLHSPLSLLKSIEKRVRLPIPTGAGSEAASGLGKTLEKGLSSSKKRGLDATMVVLFVSSLAALVTLRYLNPPAAQAGEVETQAEEPTMEHVGENAYENAYKMEQPGATINVQHVA